MLARTSSELFAGLGAVAWRPPGRHLESDPSSRSPTWGLGGVSVLCSWSCRAPSRNHSRRPRCSGARTSSVGCCRARRRGPCPSSPSRPLGASARGRAARGSPEGVDQRRIVLGRLKPRVPQAPKRESASRAESFWPATAPIFQNVPLFLIPFGLQHRVLQGHTFGRRKSICKGDVVNGGAAKMPR